MSYSFNEKNHVAEKAMEICDALGDDEAVFEFKVCVTKNCTDGDIMERFGINFKEALKEIHVTDDRSSYEINKIPERHVFKQFSETYSIIQCESQE